MRKLTDLEPSEVSLVSRGANRKKFLLLKSKGGAMAADKEVLDLLNSVPQRTLDAIANVAKSASQRVSKADDAPADDVDMARMQVSIKAAGKLLAPYKDHITPEVMQQLGDAIGGGSEAAEEEMEEEGTEDGAEPQVELSADIDKSAEEDDVEKAAVDASDMSMDKPEGVAADDHDAAMAKAKEAYKAHMDAKAEKADGKDDDVEKSKDTQDEEADVAKSTVAKSDKFALEAFPKEQRQAMEAIFKSHQDLASAHKEAVAKADKLQDKLERKEFIAKAAGFQHLGLKAEELGEKLQRMHKKDPEGAADFEAILKAADEQLRVAGHGGKGGLYAELGSRASKAGAGDAQAQIDAAVDGLVQKSASGKSKQQIERDFYGTDAGKELYAQLMIEQGMHKGDL